MEGFLTIRETSRVGVGIANLLVLIVEIHVVRHVDDGSCRMSCYIDDETDLFFLTLTPEIRLFHDSQSCPL